MDRIVIFFTGALLSVASEVFWKGESRWTVSLWGGTGMLLLRRIVLRFPSGSRALLCILGAMLLAVLRLLLLMLQTLSLRRNDHVAQPMKVPLPSLSYGLYRFLLIPPAYTIIEYLESFLRM